MSDPDSGVTGTDEQRSQVPMPETNSREVALELRDVRKTYGHNQALKGISFKVHRGEILALLGDG